MGSPANADGRALANATVREGVDNLVGERTRAADKPHIARDVNVARHNAYFGLPQGVISPGQLGPIQHVLVVSDRRAPATMSSAGTPSVMQMTSAMPASAASIMASAAPHAGT